MKVCVRMFTALALSFPATIAVAGKTLICEPGQEPGLVEPGSGIAEAPTRPDPVCPEAQFDDFDVELWVKSDNRVDVHGLGGSTELSHSTIRTTSALKGRRVGIGGDPVYTDVQENLCQMLKSRDIDVYRNSRDAISAQTTARVVEPRRAFTLTATETIWINVSDEEFEIPAVTGMRRASWAGHEEGIVDIIQRFVANQSDDNGGVPTVVLIDAAGNLEHQFLGLDFRAVDAAVYYVDGGKAAWSEWHRFNWRVNRGRQSVAEVATCIVQ